MPIQDWWKCRVGPDSKQPADERSRGQQYRDLHQLLSLNKSFDSAGGATRWFGVRNGAIEGHLDPCQAYSAK